MTPWLKDADVTLWHGDVLAVFPELPAESVDCVVTSPPYWGLRDSKRLVQCPGCWAAAMARKDVDWECECGELMTVVDLREAVRDL